MQVGRHRSGLLVGAVAIAVVAGVVGWIGGRRIQSPAEVAAGAEPPQASLAAVQVEQRVLSARIVIRASFEPADNVEFGIVAPAESLPVVTALNVEPGEDVEVGSLLLEVAERPVLALTGDLSPFRDLGLGSRGDDVAQLESSLAALELLPPGEVDGLFSTVTGAAVDALYARAGYEAVQENGVASVPRSEVVYLPSLPRRIDSVLVERGQLAEGPVVRVSSSTVVARGALTAADRHLVDIGQSASLVADDLGLDLNATVSEMADVPGGSVPAGNYAIGFTPTDQSSAAKLVGVSVRAVITLESTDDDVLVVPVAALSAGPDGAVRVERLVGEETQTVEVVTGLTAQGDVAIRPVEAGALGPGDWVVVGRSGVAPASASETSSSAGD